MSYEHTTTGWDKLEAMLSGFAASGVMSSVEPTEDDPIDIGDGWTTDLRALRRCRFRSADGRAMVAEEYLALDDGDCDGGSRVEVAIYPDGERPTLFRIVYDGGRLTYPNAPVPDEDGRTPDFCVNLTNDEVEIMPPSEGTVDDG